jgi:MFS family permease
MAETEETHNWRILQPQKKWTILRREWRAFLWALYTSVGSMMLGYDSGVAGTCVAFPAFQKAFGEPFVGIASGYLVPARIQAGWTGASVAGDIIGVIMGAVLLDRIGRKRTLIVGSLFTTVGIGMQQGAREWRLFLAGRLVNGFGFGLVFVTSPVWIGEVARPELRGFFLCLMNGSIVFAQFLLACVAQGSSKIASDWSWKLVIVLQYMFTGNVYSSHRVDVL